MNDLNSKAVIKINPLDLYTISIDTISFLILKTGECIFLDSSFPRKNNSENSIINYNNIPKINGFSTIKKCNEDNDNEYKSVRDSLCQNKSNNKSKSIDERIQEKLFNKKKEAEERKRNQNKDINNNLHTIKDTTHHNTISANINISNLNSNTINNNFNTITDIVNIKMDENNKEDFCNNYETLTYEKNKNSLNTDDLNLLKKINEDNYQKRICFSDSCFDDRIKFYENNNRTNSIRTIINLNIEGNNPDKIDITKQFKGLLDNYKNKKIKQETKPKRFYEDYKSVNNNKNKLIQNNVNELKAIKNFSFFNNKNNSKLLKNKKNKYVDYNSSLFLRVRSLFGKQSKDKKNKKVDNIIYPKNGPIF